MHKKVLFLFVFFLLSFGSGLMAASQIEKVTAYIRHDFNLLLDGKKLPKDYTILVYNERSYLPLNYIGQLLGVDIKWQNDSKSIYVNTRYSGQPVQSIDEDEFNYESIQLESLMGYNVTYLGGEYPVIANIVNYRTYYRAKDLAFMGIDIRGMRKAKEKLTGELYIQLDELKNVWKEHPIFVPSYQALVIGEKDESKIKVLTDLSNIVPPTFEYDEYGQLILPIQRHYYGIVYSIETIGKNEYEYLCYEQGQYFKYKVTLKQSLQEQWFLGSLQKFDIE